MIGDSWEELGQFSPSWSGCDALVNLGDGVLLAGGSVMPGPNEQLAKSIDYGVNWIDKGALGTGDEILSFCDRGAGRVFAGTHRNTAQTWESTDWGESWVLRHSYCKRLSAIEYCGGSVMCGGYYFGPWPVSENIARSVNDGLNWVNVGSITVPGDEIRALHHINGTNILLAGVVIPAKICRSTDNGAAASWSDVFSDAAKAGCLCFVAIEDGTIFAGIDNHIYRSTDQGQNWIDLGAITPPVENITSLVDFGNDIILGVTMNGYALRSEDAGVTWTDLGQFHTHIPASRSPLIKVETEDTIIAYVGTNGGYLLKSEMPIAKIQTPDNLLCEQKKNPIDVVDPKPEFSAIHRYE